MFDKVILARRALREITLLRHFASHENVSRSSHTDADALEQRGSSHGQASDMFWTAYYHKITGLIDLDIVHPGYNEM